MPPRATPLSPDERREALITATRPLLYEHGRAVTTRLIAEAAGVAEGTIFRVFASKDELVEAAVERALAPGDLVRRLQEIDLDLPLQERLLQMVTILQQRFCAVFGLLEAMGMVGPPEQLTKSAEHKAALDDVQGWMLALVRPDRDRLRVPPEQVVHLLRLLTFSGSHHKFTNGALLTPVEIVDTVLHGVRKRDDS